MTILKKATDSTSSHHKPQRSKSTPCCFSSRSAWLLGTQCTTPNNGIPERGHCNYYRGTVERFKYLDSLGWKPYNPTQSRSLVNFSPEVRCSKSKPHFNFIDRALCKAIENRKYFISDQATHWYRAQFPLTTEQPLQSAQEIAFNNLMNDIHGFNIKASQFERISPQFLYLLQKYHSDISLLAFPTIHEITPVLNKWDFSCYPLDCTDKSEEKCLLRLSQSDIQHICSSEENRRLGCCAFFKRLFSKTQINESCQHDKQMNCSNTSKSAKNQSAKSKESNKNFKDCQTKFQSVEKMLPLSRPNNGAYACPDQRHRPCKVHFSQQKWQSRVAAKRLNHRGNDFVLNRNMERQKSGEESDYTKGGSDKSVSPLKSILKKSNAVSQTANTKEASSQTKSEEDRLPKCRQSRSFIRNLRTKRTPTPACSHILRNILDSKTLLLEVWRKSKYKREISVECNAPKLKEPGHNKQKRLNAGFDRHTASVASYVGPKPVLSLHELHKASSFDSNSSDEDTKNNDTAPYEATNTKPINIGSPRSPFKNINIWEERIKPQAAPNFLTKANKLRNIHSQSSGFADEIIEKKIYKYPSPVERNKHRVTAHTSRQQGSGQQNQNERKQVHHSSRYDSYSGNDVRNNSERLSNVTSDHNLSSYNEDRYVDFYVPDYDQKYEEYKFSNTKNRTRFSSEQRKEIIDHSKARSESSNKWSNRNFVSRRPSKISYYSNTSLGREHRKHSSPKSNRCEQFYPIKKYDYYKAYKDIEWNEDDDRLHSSNSNEIECSLSSGNDLKRHQTKEVQKSKGEHRFQRTISFVTDDETKENLHLERPENHKVYPEDSLKTNNKFKTRYHKDRNDQKRGNNWRLSSGDEMCEISMSSNNLTYNRNIITSQNSFVPISKPEKSKRRYISSQKLIGYNTEDSHSEDDNITVYRVSKAMRLCRECGSTHESLESVHQPIKRKRETPPKSYDYTKRGTHSKQLESSVTALPNSKHLNSKLKTLKKTANNLKRYIMPSKKPFADVVNDSKYITTSQYIESSSERKHPQTSPQNLDLKNMEPQFEASSECLLPEFTSSFSRSRYSMGSTDEPNYQIQQHNSRSKYIARRTGGELSSAAVSRSRTKSKHTADDRNKKKSTTRDKKLDITKKYKPFQDKASTHVRRNAAIENGTHTHIGHISSPSSEANSNDLLQPYNSSEVLIRKAEYDADRNQVEDQGSREFLKKSSPIVDITNKNFKAKHQNLVAKQHSLKKAAPISSRKVVPTPKAEVRQRVVVKQFMGEQKAVAQRRSPVRNGQNSRNEPNRSQLESKHKRHHSTRGQKKPPVVKDSMLWRYPSSSKQRLPTLIQTPPQHAEYILGQSSSPVRRNRHSSKRKRV